MASRKNRRARRAEQQANRVALSAVPPLAQPLGLGPTPPAPPVRQPDRLVTQWSPQPTISRWIAQLSRGELNWDQVQAYTRQADLGLTERWGGFTRRMLESDAHIASTVRTYTAAISGARREIVAPKVDAEYQQIADDQAEFCARMLDGLPNVERSLAEMIDGDFTGYSVTEILYEQRGEFIWPCGLEWLTPDRIRFTQRFTPFLWDTGAAAQRARELGMEFAAVDGAGKPVDLTTAELDGLGLALPENKYIVHLPRILPNYPQAAGLFRALIRPWFIKNWVMKFMLAGAELAGNPRYLGTLPADSSAPDEVRQALYDALQTLSADSVGVVSGGSSIEILDPKMQGTGGVWEMVIKLCNAEISKAVLGSTLNVEVGDTGGNRSLGESQADMTMAPRWHASAALVGNTLSDQLLRPFLTLNRHLWGGHVFVPKVLLHISEDEPQISDIAVQKGAVEFDELRRSCRLEPWGPEKGGDQRIPAETSTGDAAVYRADVEAKASGPAPAPMAGQQQAPTADVAASAFNGAQVTSLQGMLASVKDGSLDPAAAVIAIRVAFPTVSEHDAIDMVQAQTPGGAPTRPFPASRSQRLMALSQRLR